jgi:undecaprenyl pyrophosphate synthase
VLYFQRFVELRLSDEIVFEQELTYLQIVFSPFSWPPFRKAALLRRL